jgi:hypothetical protein
VITESLGILQADNGYDTLFWLSDDGCGDLEVFDVLAGFEGGS